MLNRYRKHALAALFVVAASIALGACGASAPTGDCLSARNGSLQPAPCEAPGVTVQPTDTPTPGGGGGTPSGGAAHGEQLAKTNGCAACHSTDGSAGVGPTWKGLYGSTVTLSDGTTVTANDAYIHESIVDPGAKIVKGFPDGVMPTNFRNVLSDQDIADIIDYMKTLK